MAPRITTLSKFLGVESLETSEKVAVFSLEAIVKTPPLETARVNVPLKLRVDSDTVRANVSVD